jgi:hypothetical protein
MEDEPQDDIVSELEEADVTFEAPIERIRKATTIGRAPRESVIVSSSATSSSQLAVEYVKEETAISRAVTRQLARKASIAEAEPKSESELPVMRMRQSTLQASERQSLGPPSPIAEVKPDITRQATRQLTHRTSSIKSEPQPEPAAPPTEDVEFNAPVLRMRAYTVPPSPTAEPEAIDQEADAEERTATPPCDDSSEPILRKTTTWQSTERVPRPGPIVRKATTRRSTERLSSLEPVVRRMTTKRPTERIASPEPVMRHVTTQRPTELIPSSEPVIRHVTTRRPMEELPTPEPVVDRVLTRQSTERSPLSEPMVRRVTTRRPMEKILSPEPPIRRVTIRKPTKRLPLSEPAIERALTRQVKEPLPSPEEIIRRVITGKRTEPLEESPAPPSSPSTQAEEPPLPVRAPTAYDFEDTTDGEPCEDIVLPVSRAAQVPPRTAAFPPEVQRQATTPATRVSIIRRQYNQPDQIALPKSPSSFSSQALSTHKDFGGVTQEPLKEEEDEFVPWCKGCGSPRQPTSCLQKTYSQSLLLSGNRRYLVGSLH